MSFFPSILSIFLILSSILHTLDACFKQPSNSTDGFEQEENFRRRVILDDPLFYGDSIHGILALCEGHKKPNEEEMKSPERRNELTTCEHERDPEDETGKKRNMTKIELFLLIEAQKKFQKQQDMIKDKRWMIVSCVMFIIPFLMALYLVIRGHYRVGNVPPFNQFIRPRPDKSEGVKYNIFTWMKFRILPGSHPEMKKSSKDQSTGPDRHSSDPMHKDKETTTQQRVKWCKYDKEDERLDPKKIKINLQNMKFRFHPRTDYLKLLSALEDDDAHSDASDRSDAESKKHPKLAHSKHGSHHNKEKKRGPGKRKKSLTTKGGWDFVTQGPELTSSHALLHKEARSKKEKKIHHRSSKVHSTGSSHK